jgi:phosphatidate cytidylyltransferase
MPGLGLALSPLIVWSFYSGYFIYTPLIISVDLIVVAALTLPIFKTDSNAPHLVGKQVLGLVYIPVFLSFLVLTRLEPNGAHWIFWIICIVFAGDIGAYYTGTYLGRHKLCPWVSPKKTIEGSLGGLVSNVHCIVVQDSLPVDLVDPFKYRFGPCHRGRGTDRGSICI